MQCLLDNSTLGNNDVNKHIMMENAHRFLIKLLCVGLGKKNMLWEEYILINL